MRFSSNKKIIAAIAVSMAMILFLAWVTFFLQRKGIVNSSETYQKEKLNYFVLQEKKDKLLQMKNELVDLEAQEKNLEAVFIKKDEAIPFIRQLEKIAEDSSCSLAIEPADLGKIKFGQVQKPQSNPDNEEGTTKTKNQSQDQQKEEKKKDDLADVRNYPAFSVSVTGSFPSAVNFLSEMENLPFFIRPLVIDVSIDKKGSSGIGPEAGTLAVGNQNLPEAQKSESKNVKMTLIIVIYGE